MRLGELDLRWTKTSIIVLAVVLALLGCGYGDAIIYAASGQAEQEKPKIALTFDDGPHRVYTETLLNGLKERNVKATFFVIGKNVEGNETLIKRMDDEGHLIGNHTYDHVRISGMNEADACAQITKTSDVIKAITGKDTEYVRPPFGQWDAGLECGIEMFPVMWTIDPRDWTTKNVNQIVSDVVKKADEDGIILLHDWYGTSVEAAFQIIDLLQAEGYEFVTVDELILE